MITESQSRIADSILEIENAGPYLSERRNIFDACTNVALNRVKDSVNYQKTKIKKFGRVVFDVWLEAIIETAEQRTCDADWFSRADAIVSKKLGYLSMDELFEESAKRFRMREEYLDSLEIMCDES